MYSLYGTWGFPCAVSYTHLSALVESSLGYHPDSTGVLTGCHESGDWTLLGGQFDWGGRLLKSNGGAQRLSLIHISVKAPYEGDDVLFVERANELRYVARLST